MTIEKGAAVLRNSTDEQREEVTHWRWRQQVKRYHGGRAQALGASPGEHQQPRRASTAQASINSPDEHQQPRRASTAQANPQFTPCAIKLTHTITPRDRKSEGDVWY
ncbi:hypothetical protein [Pedosphaera parvula]|uniref:hypothetical protein n=1 Tax=Pedosphaera parvula TaxID=1032527 RepID=UPI00058F2965|nr:hypothetical protein [Pedosphaera parvula]